jgi:hypothetical protein
VSTDFLAVEVTSLWEADMSNEVAYAMTDDGVRMAVIDVTHPAFAVAANEAELAAMAEQYIREAGQRREIPEAMREALRNSMLGRGLISATETYLDGMSTYLLKLGPENLGKGATPIDLRIAASLPAFATRLRLQDMARSLADGLAGGMAAEKGRPVCLVNIAGGPASDSWNALIQLRIEHAELLDGREIAIAVLDLDERGPAFGMRAVGALCVPAAPLGGLRIGFTHVRYDWTDVNRLRQVLEEMRASEALCGISSEGGLFEYGSDEEIVSNLRALHGGTAEDAIVVGSVTRDGGPVRASLTTTRFLTRPRTMEAFQTLAEEGGWKVQAVVERPFSFNVRLVKA